MSMDRPPPIPTDDAIHGLLAQRVSRCGLSPGMVAGITEGGKHRVIAYGVADKAGRPVGGDTLFEIGSITKLFTAVLLADMVHRGGVTLGTPVSKLLPHGTSVPSLNGQPITLAQLARHTSGLPRLPANLPATSPDPYGGYTADMLYAFLAEHVLARTPGEAVEYSNLGAGLLGHALGLWSGQGFERLLRDRILDPLGMASTALQATPALAARSASGHDDSGDPVPSWTFDVLAGAGGLRSTASDMLLFLDALLRPGEPPLGQAAALLLAPLAAGGLGFGLPQPEGHVAFQHEGGTGGFRSYAGGIPAWQRGAVVLANASTGACADLGIHLCDARWSLAWHREPVAVDPACFDRLVGCYRMTPAMLLDVTRQGGRLMVQLTGQAACRVFPLSEWAVFYKVVNAQITFLPGPDGRAARLVLHQNGRDQTAERIG